jgi:hypothetical protein
MVVKDDPSWAKFWPEESLGRESLGSVPTPARTAAAATDDPRLELYYLEPLGSVNHGKVEAAAHRLRFFIGQCVGNDHC